MRSIPLNYITLRFNSDKLEQRYKRASVKLSLKVIRSALILGCLLIPIFGILDIWMVPEKLLSVWGIRIALVSLLLIVYLLSFRPFFRNYSQILMIILMIVLGVGIISMVLISETEGGYFYYAGLMLVIQFTHGLIRLRFINATIASLVIAITYLFIAWSIKNTPSEVIINNSFFLFSTVIVGMFISYSLEFYMRGNFWQRILVSRQKNLLKSEYQRKSKELENIRQLQLAILPKKVPQLSDIEIATSVFTAVEVGGDYYDFKNDETNRLSFAIGDATGHGAQAGALVTASKILFTCWTDNKDTEGFINEASKSIKQMGIPKLFMAMIAGRFDNGVLEIAGGGLPPALIYRNSTNAIEEIPLKGFPLGCVGDYSYKKRCIPLGKNDLLLFMTDGLTELFNREKEMLGIDNVKRAFLESVNEKPSVITDSLNRTIDRWRNGFPLMDDITFIVFKIKNQED